MTQLIDPKKFTEATTALRSFFLSKGFVEVHTQNRLSILAACEDPTTVATYNYAGEVWPLPQTGQMWLEYELLNNPEVPGFFCVSTSYREEKNITEGRHDIIFPMFEFEMPGNIKDLEKMERELCEHMGFGNGQSIVDKDYLDWCEYFKVEELEHKHEDEMCKSWQGRVCMIKNFPNYTSPFWNMKQNGDGTAAKIDVIISGQETIGSAERSSDPDEMLKMFHEISDGMYADLLYDKFGKERVDKELDDFLSLDFMPRVGGGIGITRLLSAMNNYEVRRVIANM
jgi:aspartyl/asparaginyl-tRNA synthetase